MKWKLLSHVWLFGLCSSSWILQARMLEWIAFPFCRGSSQHRDWTQVSCSCRRILYQLSHKGSSRILEWAAYPFSRGSSQHRNRTGVFSIAGGFFTSWAMREALFTFRRKANKIPWFNQGVGFLQSIIPKNKIWFPPSSCSLGNIVTDSFVFFLYYIFKWHLKKYINLATNRNYFTRFETFRKIKKIWNETNSILHKSAIEFCPFFESLSTETSFRGFFSLKLKPEPQAFSIRGISLQMSQFGTSFWEASHLLLHVVPLGSHLVQNMWLQI